MTDLVLINPNCRSVVYQGLDTLASIEPPLWCRLIAGYIRNRNYSVHIIDAEASNLDAGYTATAALALKPKLICVVAFGHQPSASTQQMVGCREVLDKLGRSQSKVPTILVGGHVSALPQRTLTDEICDYACVGEGPVTILGLLEGKQNHEIPGLVWYSDSLKCAQVNKSAPNIEEMDRDMRGDVWDLLPMSLYRAHNWQCFDGSPRTPYSSIYTSLGCPYVCNFCMINAPFEGNRYRMISPDAVVQQITRLYVHYGVTTFKIADEMFVLNPRHVSGICDVLIDSGIAHELNIWAYARVDTVKPQMLGKLKQAGIRWLALGIESGSQFVRDGAEKKLKNNDIVGVVRAIQRAGINVIGNFIFGLPDDTLDSMKETLALAQELNCEFANFYSAMAYPGSKLYEDSVKKNMRLPQHWSGYSQHSYDCTPLGNEKLSSRDVLEFRDEAFDKYFTHNKYISMIERKFGATALNEIHSMTSRRLKRELLGD